MTPKMLNSRFRMKAFLVWLCIGVEPETSEMDTSKLGQIKPKLPACSDTTKGK